MLKLEQHKKMGKRFIITEEEKKRILGLYEQDEPTPETTDEKPSLIDTLKQMGFEESSDRIGLWQIKKDDNTYAAVLTLNPTKDQISKAEIVGTPDILSTIQKAFNEVNIPNIISGEKLITRAPFKEENLIKKLSEPAKSEF